MLSDLLLMLLHVHVHVHVASSSLSILTFTCITCFFKLFDVWPSTHTELKNFHCELHVYMYIINPRCACAARVTVLGLCVCLSTNIVALQAMRWLKSDTNSFSATRA